jgi:hypothetical protein
VLRGEEVSAIHLAAAQILLARERRQSNGPAICDSVGEKQMEVLRWIADFTSLVTKASQKIYQLCAVAAETCSITYYR